MLNANKILYSTTILISALLFSIQPMFSKGLLPIFGGSGIVWISSILFYQTVLLIGYLYAAGVVKYLSKRNQVITHIILLLVSLLFVPISIKTFLIFEEIWPPINILILLSVSILIPFMVISSTAPLLSKWYYAIDHNHFVYRLYSVSSIGCLIGVMSYPFVVEYWLGLKLQFILWSSMYAAYIIMAMICAFVYYRQGMIVQTVASKHERIPLIQFIKWTFYSFLASALLYAVSQFLVQNAINLPLMWVLPLGLFLIAYAIVFSRPISYDKTFWGLSYIIWFIITGLIIYTAHWSGYSVIIVLLALLYCGCMVTLGELFNIRPDQAKVVGYYTAIALGGVLGGAFIHASNFIMNRAWDFFSVLIILALIVLKIQWRMSRNDKLSWNLFLMVFSCLGFMFFCFALTTDLLRSSDAVIARLRNVYGLIQVKEYRFKDPSYDYRMLLHGKIMHGAQYMDPLKSKIATTYYGPDSGVNLAIEYLDRTREQIAVGVVGLGVGTLTALLRPQDSIEFYEIDPDVVKIANQYFNFLTKSKHVQISIGDARVSLSKELNDPSKPKYDILAIDAFGGDGIPYHLMTQEAMELYHRHLKTNGIVAIHASNTYLDFYPVTLALAKNLGCAHYWVASKPNYDKGLMSSTWALISCDPNLEQYLIQKNAKIVVQDVNPLLWTDDFNSILPLIKWGSL